MDKTFVTTTTCFYCTEAADVIFDTRLRNVFESTQIGIRTMEPCAKCEAHMKNDIILIGVDDEKSDMEQYQQDKAAWDRAMKISGIFGSRSYEAAMRKKSLHPYVSSQEHLSRSGHFLVVKESFVTNNFKPQKLVADILKHRWSFIDGRLAQAIIDQNETSAE